ILTSFLEVLLLEEGEVKLSKSMKSDLESTIQEFSEKMTTEPSLEEYFKTIKNIPRKDLLSRWVGKGVYGNAFTLSKEVIPKDNRLTYYNFSKISQALDPDYAQGGLAAVMAK